MCGILAGPPAAQREQLTCRGNALQCCQQQCGPLERLDCQTICGPPCGCVPGRKDGAVQIPRQQLQEGQPKRHVTSILLKEEDGGPLAPCGFAPAHGMEIPGMELGAIPCCQVHILYGRGPSLFALCSDVCRVLNLSLLQGVATTCCKEEQRQYHSEGCWANSIPHTRGGSRKGSTRNCWVFQGFLECRSALHQPSSEYEPLKDALCIDFVLGRHDGSCSLPAAPEKRTALPKLQLQFHHPTDKHYMDKAHVYGHARMRSIGQLQ